MTFIFSYFSVVLISPARISFLTDENSKPRNKSMKNKHTISLPFGQNPSEYLALFLSLTSPDLQSF